MEPFHAFLGLACSSCNEKLIRVAWSENNDLAVCPSCLSAGAYEEVLEEGTGDLDRYDLPEETKSFIRRLRPLKS